MCAFPYNPHRGIGMTRQDSLECIPEKCHSISESLLENGDVLILYPENPNPWVSRVLSWMGKTEGRVRMRKLQLDALGSQVWRLVDGYRTVLELVDVFAQSHQLHHREAEIAVVQFIRELGRRQIIFLK